MHDRDADAKSVNLARLPDGGQLAYSVLGVAGDEPPILLNRPLGGSMTLWGDFAGRLARHFQVVSFDPRGIGRSSDVPRWHTTRAMGRDAVALLDALGLHRVHVFGVSLGGMVASWIAFDSPERVARLVLASTVPEVGALSRRALTKAFGFARCLLKPGVEAELCLVRQVVSPGFAEAHPERMAEIERCARRTPARRENLLHLALAAARHQGRPLPQELMTLLLFGELDPIAGKASRTELLRDCPQATLEILAGVGHDLPLEQPHQVADRISAFLLEPLLTEVP